MIHPTKNNQVTVRVIRDNQDLSTAGWAYQVYDGSPDMRQSDLVLVSSGTIKGRQTTIRPSRARALASSGVSGGRYTHVVYL